MNRQLSALALRLVSSAFSQKIATACNALPLPFDKLPVHLDRGVMFSQRLDRYLALWLWKLGWLASDETRLLKRMCPPGTRAVDIGANIGFHTLQLAQLAGPTGFVWAFEPDPSNYATLTRNLEANHCRNVSAVNLAVANRSGQAAFYVSSSHSGDHRLFVPDPGARKKITVQAVALDDFFPACQSLDLIKMDIQGAEGIALEGMKRILESNPKLILMFEFWPFGLRQSGSQPERMLANLRDLGFRLSRIGGDGRDQNSPGESSHFNESQHYVNLLARRERA